MQLAEIRKHAEQFDSKIDQALRIKYQGHDIKIQKILLGHHQLITTLSLSKIIDEYLDKKIYPTERLAQVVSLFMDIKLQVYFINEVDLGLYGIIGYTGSTLKGITENPYLFLKHLSLDQSIILKSTILWERIMNLIYYLETGNRLDVGRSKKRKFAKFIVGSDKWKFVERYLEYISLYDDKFRTPEVHKNSTIRSHFSTGELLNPESILLIINIVANLWQNILNVISGDQTRYTTWNTGMDEIKKGEGTA